MRALVFGSSLVVALPLAAGCGGAGSNELSTPVSLPAAGDGVARGGPAPRAPGGDAGRADAGGVATTAAESPPDQEAKDAGATEATRAPAPAGPPLPDGATVLVVGDSFSQSLGVGLKPILKEQGVRVVIKGEKATFIPEWAGTKMGMELAVMQYKPDLVVIVLGGNELGIKDPSIRATRVDKVAANARDVPCVWVAPALWEFGDPHGMLEVLRAHSRPCRYYDTGKFVKDLPRGGDKIHPDINGQRMWAEAFLDWVKRERDYDAQGFAFKPRPDGE
jgi:lysophospholipase L1-like esterase